MESQIINLKNIVINTIISLNEYKKKDILYFNDTITNTNSLKKIYNDLENIELEIIENNLNYYTDFSNNYDIFIEYISNKKQNVVFNLAKIFCLIGTKKLNDLINICFGNSFFNSFRNTLSNIKYSKYLILSKHLHPINYKIIEWKNKPKTQTIRKNRIVEDFSIVEQSETLDCFDLARTSNNNYIKVYGIKLSIQNNEDESTMIISCIIDDIIIDCFKNNDYIKFRLFSLLDEKPKIDDFNNKKFNKFIECLTIKDLLIYNNTELYDRYICYLTNIKLMKKKPLSQLCKEFICNDMYLQRKILIQLLFDNDQENHYIAHMLYDLLKEDNNNQTILYDSLPVNIKCYLKNTIKNNIKLINKFNVNINIPLEQQINLLKVDDSVKEKAYNKLKEVNAKTDESGAKAKQYLDGLLKIPFQIYKEEPILKLVKENMNLYSNILNNINDNGITQQLNNLIIKKKNISNIEIINNVELLNNKLNYFIKYHFIDNQLKSYINDKRPILIYKNIIINNFIKIYNIKYKRLLHSGKKKNYLINNIKNFFYYLYNNNQLELIIDFFKLNDYDMKFVNIIHDSYNQILMNNCKLKKFMNDSNIILDNSVYGHQDVKLEIQKIFSQWINGGNQGYCFGFEGPPGVGKTSLAKNGISKCLIDENGEYRPFHFIGIGGSSNGSTLEGHSYTYVGSTWGKIVDILMTSKCMNPIIFIDELDKISNTEKGRELIGILTHLTDYTQNDEFQDKYFNGINIDLSKVLFIFSYNNPSNIDKILLDRIHRVKFEPLLLEDKIKISKLFLLPEIFNKMGLYNIIDIEDNIIEHIIKKYTCEPGVRKLKEILFDIIGSINIDILNNKISHIPIHLNINDIDKIYLKKKSKITITKIHKSSTIGIINGLWANSYGMGGIISIEASFYPSNVFLDYKLTGMQGDVMKESMNVAKTLAWNLYCNSHPKKISDFIDEITINKLQGIHVHAPEGATPKDGPSAGAAITTILYSLLTKKKINNLIAITGEICLKGNVTKIGGLDKKIIGGIDAGVKTFIFPKDNHEDFILFKNNNNGNLLNNINFIEVNHIEEILNIVFVD